MDKNRKRKCKMNRNVGNVSAVRIRHATVDCVRAASFADVAISLERVICVGVSA